MNPSLEAEKDRRAYGLALDFLKNVDHRVTSEIISHHLLVPPRPDNIQDVFRRLIISAKNAGMKGNVIKDKDIDYLKEILCGDNPSEITQRYDDNSEKLLNCIKVKLGRDLRTERKSIWPGYCKTIIEGSSFLNRFSNVKEFHEFVAIFHDNPKALPALPCLLAKEIHGFGFALACDFLKEIGYENYSKPDTYLKDILPKLSLSKNSDDLVVFRAVTRIAKNVGKTAYNVDKLFWLVGSGNFYFNNLNIKGHAAECIAYAKPQLESYR